MMTTKRLGNFEVVCEWGSCSFTGRSMEELSDHMCLHLKDYLGDNDALEELGKRFCVQGWARGSAFVGQHIKFISMGFNGQCLVQVLSSLNMPVEFYKEVFLLLNSHCGCV